MHDLALFRPDLRPIWFSPENPTGAPGGACRSDDGRKRRPNIPVPAGASVVLAECVGSGTLRRIWLTVSDRSPVMLRGLRLECYWDGAHTPAVSVPLGDFFGHALGQEVAFANALFSSPEGRSFCTTVPMPFKSGARVVVTNETETDLPMLFYDVDGTVGDSHDDAVLYFHSHWRRESPTTLGADFALLPEVTGRGRFLGVTVGVIPDRERYFKTWWGEGEVKVYLDGDTTHPTLCGTGTEDYIGTGWGQGHYAHAYQGCPLVDADPFWYGFYRLHVADPIFFSERCRVTIQQIGWADWTQLAEMYAIGTELIHGGQPLDVEAIIAARSHSLFERQDDWSSVAYFYLDRPENGLPPLAPLAERVAGTAVPKNLE